MRRAAWRDLPDEPTNPARWVPRVLTETPTLLLFSALGCALLAWGLGLTVLLGVAAFSIAGLFLLPYRSARPRPDLLTLPLPPGSFPVGVTVRLFRDPTGADDAVASFVDGWLHVEGARTSFSLRVEDASFELSSSDGALVASLPGGQGVRIVPAIFVSTASNPSLAGGSSFFKTAERWLRERADVPGDPVLPPLKPQPHVYARTAVRSVLLVLTCLASLGAIGRLTTDGRTFWLFIGLLTLAVATPVYCAHRLLFLRRIDAGALRPHEREGLAFEVAEDDGA